MKSCSLCKEEKPNSAFYLRTDGRQYGNLSSRCKECVKIESGEALLRFPEKGMLNAAKHRAKKNWLPFDLDEHREELRERLAAGHCEMTGLPFAMSGPRDWNSPSIDRIEPELGYVYGNIRLILWSLNSAFGYWGEGQFEVVARAWLERKSLPC